MARKQYHFNVVGSRTRRLRGELDFTQEQLAPHCQLSGLDISRCTLGQIKARRRYVTDNELLALASLVGETLVALYPHELLKRRRKKKKKIEPRKLLIRLH
jgi:transcriptional regulator with XRE-family HTH domain